MTRNVFRSIKIAHFITAVIGAVIVFLLVKDTKGSLVLGTVLAFILALFIDFIFFKIYIRKCSRILALRDNCHTYQYISEIQKLLDTKQNKQNMQALKLNLYAGYSDIGDFKRGKEVLFSVQPQFKKNAVGVMQAIVYYMNVCDYHMAMKEFDKAKEALETARTYLNSPLCNEQQRNNLLRNYEEMKMQLNMECGDYDGAEKYFLLVLETEKTPLIKAAANKALAMVYIHEKNFEKAKACCQCILEIGGEINHVNWAREQLDKMEQAS